MRQTLVVLHRYVGLIMTLFLVIVGFTGIFIAFNDELDGLIHPEVMYVEPPSNQAMINPIALTALVLKEYPNAMITRIDLNQVADKSRRFYLEPRPNLPENTIINNEIFVNPYTAKVLGERKWGDITQGTINLLPFIYRLHFSLALGIIGNYALGIIALFWTLDCFVGAYLTFPPQQRKSAIKNKEKDSHWLKRWWKAWKIRWQGGFSKVNFDCHRAGGLWVWAMLFVFAWSSVALNLREIYTPVMKTVFAHQAFEENLPNLSQPLITPVVDFNTALNKGRAYMREISVEKKFSINHESRINYNTKKGIYTYIVNSSRDISEKNTSTAITISAVNGKLLSVYLPTGAASGDTITEWLLALHMAKVWGLPMQIFVSAMGLLVVGLTMTGFIIWLKKRKSRHIIKQKKSTYDENQTD